MEPMTEQPMIDYQASCHCGRVRFSFRSREITTGVRCDCSLCQRRGAVLSSRYIPPGDFTPHRNQSDLGLYRWNERVLQNHFCKTCGVFTYIADGRDGYRVNLGCVDGLDIFALEVGRIDGKSVPRLGR